MGEILYTYKFKVTKVVDGDTVYGDADLGFGVSMAIKVRLYGINAPEMRGQEKEAGRRSKSFLKNVLSKSFKDNHQIYIETIKDKKGKYGRWLGIIHVQGIQMTINAWLVANGHAKYKEY